MNTTDLILAIDQGTTGSTCLLIDRELTVLARATENFPQYFPEPGLVEHDPDELWSSVTTALSRVIAAASESSGTSQDALRYRISAIGITNQRETSLIWNRNDSRPLHRALVWQDRRTEARCQDLRDQGLEAQFKARTGLVLDPYFSGTKIAWVLDKVPGAREAAGRGELAAGTIDTYLLWRLTSGAVHATEPSNASRTLLWPLDGIANGDREGWDPQLCAWMNVPTEVLPDVYPSTHRFGETRGVPGLPDGIPIHGMAGDQQAALFGQACFTPGDAKCTYGTGAFMMLNTGDVPIVSRHGLLTTVGWQIGNRTTYCLEGSAFMAGAVVQWLRDELKFFVSSADIEDLAASVPDSAGVIFVPGHAGLGAPHWRPHARGLISGLTRGSGRAHIARAALEGIALECTDLLEAMTADRGQGLRQLRVDGGAAANNLLMQIQADLLGIVLERPKMLECTALGATFLAGLGVGMWRGPEDLRAAWSCERRFDPCGAPSDHRNLRERWSQALKNA